LTSEAELIARKIGQARPHAKRGAFAFLGVWFGRPYDHVRTLANGDATKDTLKLYFDQGEILSVEHPEDSVMGDSPSELVQQNMLGESGGGACGRQSFVHLELQAVVFRA
jgi:hypothetical protein